MRNPLRLFALAASVTACHSSRPAPYLTPELAPPLEAWLAPAQLMRGFGEALEFHVNRPAHVAIFEIVPYRGISLLYPGFTAQAERHTAGFHRGSVPFVTGRWYYLTSPIGLQQPRFLLMIASLEPLRVDRMLDHPSSLRSDFGIYSFAARDPDVAIDQLLNVVLPGNAHDDSWATDVYVDWSNVDRRSHTLFADAPLRSRARWVRCADGRLVYAYDSVWLSNCYRSYVRRTRPTTTSQEQPRVAEARRRDVVTDLDRSSGRRSRELENATPGSRTDVDRRSASSLQNNAVRSEPRPTRERALPAQRESTSESRQPPSNPRSEPRSGPAPQPRSDARSELAPPPRSEPRAKPRTERPAEPRPP
ncbi:MAG TPA: hypothetical protein VJ803_08225, partial [Gemmatimonadaceae bacterium]|nr:hypothetical protein [Gemmatimonadaceae bacterium]